MSVLCTKLIIHAGFFTAESRLDEVLTIIRTAAITLKEPDSGLGV